VRDPDHAMAIIVIHNQKPRGDEFFERGARHLGQFFRSGACSGVLPALRDVHEARHKRLT
jgi:hypothetical protein